MGTVRAVNSRSEFDTLLNATKSPPSLLVVDFWATWCQPCIQIAPAVQRFAAKYPHAVFAKVDVDAQQAIARTYQVTAMPTFKLFKDGTEVDSLRGADPRGLEEKIRQHYIVPQSTGGTQSETSSAQVAAAVNGYPDITSNVDVKNVECLNQQDSHPVRNIVAPGSGYLESDVDEQLSIFLSFLQHCKIFAISLTCHSKDHSPKTLRLYINRQNAIGFDEAESIEPTQEIVLSESSYDAEGTAAINLRFVKFQRVNSLTIFVVDNLGGEETTRIENLRLYGETMDVTRMSEIKKKDDEHS